MLYLLAKTVHIVGAICWMGALLYLVRLCVYHAETNARPEAERAILHPQLELMQYRLLRLITEPAMVVTLVGGIAMLVSLQAVPSWLYPKLALVVGLVVYHLSCAKIVRDQAAGVSAWTGTKLRVWNEVGTLFLVAIVTVAVFKTALSLGWALLAFAVFAGALVLAGWLYAAVRRRNA